MKQELINKYRPFGQIELKDRKWPDRIITNPPIWCSVDLRDGNQALVIPMSIEEKTRMFQLLVDIGFKQIEVGFPSAAQVEFDFLRKLIKEKLIPDDVTVQVLTQAREHLILRTFEALRGTPNAILHLYNSTSTLQREVVFNMNRDQIKNLAINGTKLVKDLSAKTDTQITLEYSPESFTGTESDYAVEVCEAVMDIWEPDTDNKIILNLPATVEMSTPNIYADQIEWFCRNLKDRDKALISLHTHNDRGTGVAASELGLMAGADRVEGTLFGNGERTGNVDIITLALNMYSQGIDPNLDLHDLDRIITVSEECTRIPVHVRHPYAGELVYTAFSGSHQDAINKGMRQVNNSGIWAVPYLPIDPSDLGRNYEAIIRINSQSGKGGVSYILEHNFGCVLPKSMHPEVALAIQSQADKTGNEIYPDDVWQIFEREFINYSEPLKLISFHSSAKDDESGIVESRMKINFKNEEKDIIGKGNGPIDSARHALMNLDIPSFRLVNYQEHALSQGSDSKAIAYIQLEMTSGRKYYGAGVDPDINKASILAMISALNRTFSI